MRHVAGEAAVSERIFVRSDERFTLTFDEWARVKMLADARMKANNGHSFMTILKTRCQQCGRSPRVKTRCGGWFQTFLFHVDSILLNLDDERAEWASEKDAGEAEISACAADNGGEKA